MKKQFLILLFLGAMSSTLNGMETTPTLHHPGADESVWTRLHSELQQIVLSIIALQKAENMGEILGKLKQLGTSPLFEGLASDKTFIADLAKKYIERDRYSATEEFLRSAHENKKPIVQALIDGGIDVNAQDRILGFTALIDAAFYGNEKIVKKLLKAGANVNAQHRDDHKTPLMYAAEHGYKEIVRMLLDAGADVNFQDNVYHRTALFYAKVYRYDEIVEMLKAAGAQ
jgi:hypothetical protein